MQRNVIVLGAIDRIVDELTDVGPIKTAFMWSPSHEQLAFVAGHDIQIHNFFGPNTCRTSPMIARQQRSAVAINSTNLRESRSIFKEFDYIK